MGLIERPARGFYAPANPVYQPKRTRGMPLTPEEQEADHERMALEIVARMKEDKRKRLASYDVPLTRVGVWSLHVDASHHRC